MGDQEQTRQAPVCGELPVDEGKPLEELEGEDHRAEPTEMQDGGE